MLLFVFAGGEKQKRNHHNAIDAYFQERDTKNSWDGSGYLQYVKTKSDFWEITEDL